MEMFFSTLILGTEYELKNRYMHVDYTEDNSQSVNPKVPKSQFDTLECTLEELAVLELIFKNLLIKQKELVIETGKSLSTINELWNLYRKRNLDSRNKSFIMIVTEPTTPLIFMRNPVGLFHLWSVLCINIQNKY